MSDMCYGVGGRGPDRPQLTAKLNWRDQHRSHLQTTVAPAASFAVTRPRRAEGHPGRARLTATNPRTQGVWWSGLHPRKAQWLPQRAKRASRGGRRPQRSPKGLPGGEASSEHPRTERGLGMVFTPRKYGGSRSELRGRPAAKVRRTSRSARLTANDPRTEGVWGCGFRPPRKHSGSRGERSGHHAGSPGRGSPAGASRPGDANGERPQDGGGLGVRVSPPKENTGAPAASGADILRGCPAAGARRASRPGDVSGEQLQDGGGPGGCGFHPPENGVKGSGVSKGPTTARALGLVKISAATARMSSWVTASMAASTSSTGSRRG